MQTTLERIRAARLAHKQVIADQTATLRAAMPTSTRIPDRFNPRVRRMPGEYDPDPTRLYDTRSIAPDPDRDDRRMADQTRAARGAFNTDARDADWDNRRAAKRHQRPDYTYPVSPEVQTDCETRTMPLPGGLQPVDYGYQRPSERPALVPDRLPGMGGCYMDAVKMPTLVQVQSR